MAMLFSFTTRLLIPRLLILVTVCSVPNVVQIANGQAKRDAKHQKTGNQEPDQDPDLKQFGIYQSTAAIANKTDAVATRLPLKLQPKMRIALIGNTLLEREQHFGHFETLLHQQFPKHQLIVRNLAWPGDTPNLQPRPENFATTVQHLTHEKVDIVFAAFGFNESFAGANGESHFRHSLRSYVEQIQGLAFNGTTGPKIVLVSPIANENTEQVAAADLNNDRLASYVEIIEEVAAELGVGFADVFGPLDSAMAESAEPLTINGCHLTDRGYAIFAEALFRESFGDATSAKHPHFDQLQRLVVDKNRQYFRRFRPLNTFYYTGGRKKSYGYLDFLPAMRNFDLLVANREREIWRVAAGGKPAEKIDDSNLPALPQTAQSRGANQWMSAADELKAFKIDPRFEVNLFAGEEQFPDIAAPIQMRWDARGRLWVSCSTTYPHVYPGQEPNDKLVILEDTDGDGRADKSSVFADNLHIPLSFEFGDGGVYVSEMPHLTFIKDTDGDGKADLRKRLLTGFGTEDSHHSLHDFAWTPDGDLIFRESVFHHSQVETPHGPVRQRNSGWFRFDPESQRLISFGTYPSTNPWGVTFDDWGQHMASHPVYAAAFHALDPIYPKQHPRPAGLQAYSGVCGHEFVDFKTFPSDLQGHFIKVRYKPTNRVEILRWKEYEFGFKEEYIGDLIFSSNLSFIPVDLRFGPRGAMYVCDWYNPIKGHAQYSLRDERRDRHSGRIWRITTKGLPTQSAPDFSSASIDELLEYLKRPEYRYRYWAKRQLRERNRDEVANKLAAWVVKLDPKADRYEHHRMEAIWTYRWIKRKNPKLLRAALTSEDARARAAATEQLRYWHTSFADVADLIRAAANDSSSIVRMQAIIAASYIGNRDVFDAAIDVLKHPSGGHLEYAIQTSLNSRKLVGHWQGKHQYNHVSKFISAFSKQGQFREPNKSASQAQFDKQKNLKSIQISCVPEKMLFSVNQFSVKTGQPVKIIFTNPDATDHNLIFVQPGKLSEVGIAANEMAKDPKNANSDFVPPSKKNLILQATPLIGPTRNKLIHVLRFKAPTEPGIYPYVCTFPGHWVIMQGEMIVGRNQAEIDKLISERTPTIVQKWKMNDFGEFKTSKEETAVMRGMRAFVKANCHACHVVAGHGVNLGPDLAESTKKVKGKKLLEQIVEPSKEIHEKFQTYRFLLFDGRTISGVVTKQTDQHVFVMPNMLNPNMVVQIAKQDIDERSKSTNSLMPEGLLNVLTKEEILDLVSYLEAGDYQLPEHLQDKHGHTKKW